VKSLEELNAAQELKIMVLTKERDEAYKQLTAEEQKVDWYWYVLGGVAVGVAGTALLKK
jgi:hypothetical protein